MNYHILGATNKAIQVVFHLAVPGGTNIAGKTYAACIAEDDSVGKVTVLPSGHLDVGEDAELLAGTLYEFQDEVPYNNGLTNAQKKALVDARYTQLAGLVNNQITRQYQYWGFKTNVT